MKIALEKHVVWLINCVLRLFGRELVVLHSKSGALLATYIDRRLPAER